MISTSTWLRSPLVTFGGATMTVLLMLTFYADLLVEYENTFGNKTMDVANLTIADGISATPESTTTLPDEYYMIGRDGFKVLKSDCRKFLMILAKRCLKELNSCIKVLRKQIEDKDEFYKKFGCATKCFMERVQMIEPTGYLSEGSYDKFVKLHIPTKYHKVASQLAIDCLDTYIPLVKPDDEYCVAYGDVFKCMQNTVDEKCRAPPKPSV